MGGIALQHTDVWILLSAKFRLVIFRPFVGEVITGRVKSCSSSGVRGKLKMRRHWMIY